MHDGSHHGVSTDVSPIEKCVKVWQKCVADAQVVFGTFHQHRVGTKKCRILRLKKGKIIIIQYVIMLKRFVYFGESMSPEP